MSIDVGSNAGDERTNHAFGIYLPPITNLYFVPF
jgi:hypothetical protein